MLLLRVVVWMFSLGTIVLGAGVVSGQDYPKQPIRFVVGSVGAGHDFIVRLMAPGLSSGLGQPVIVDNRSGFIPGDIVSKAQPDGYTLLLAGNSFMTAQLLQIAPYDVVRDFSPITLVSTEPNVLAVHPSLPVKQVKELIALAKAHPGKLNYSHGSTGGSSHIAGELFKSMASVNIVRIPYKGTGAALNALVGGEVSFCFSSAPALAPHVKSGRLRAIAVTTAEPSALMPGLPPVAATVPGYLDVGISGVFAPAKTPEAIIKRLNQEIVRVLHRPEVKEKLFSIGAEVAGGSPEQLAAAAKADMARTGKVIKDAGIKAE